MPEVDARADAPRAARRGGRGHARRAAAEDAAAVDPHRHATPPASAPRELRFLNTDEGLVAFVTLGLDAGSRLADAHARASEIEERIRRERPDIADVIVHTEP